VDDNAEFFTRATWRPSKKRRMQKRVKPYGGRKTAPAAFLEAAKLVGFTPGRTNRRICNATKKDGTPCGMLALSDMKVCGAHGGFRIWGRQGKLQKTGRTEAAKAARVAAAETSKSTPIAPLELTQLPIWKNASQWDRMRLARVYRTALWASLISQLIQRQHTIYL
jgi:hypothetical protein